MLPTLRLAAALAIAAAAMDTCESPLPNLLSNDCMVNKSDRYDVYNLTFEHSMPDHCPVNMISGGNVIVSGMWKDGGTPDFEAGTGVAVNQPDAQVVRSTIVFFQLEDGKWQSQAIMNYPAATGHNVCLDIVTWEMAQYFGGAPVLDRTPNASVRINYHWYNNYPACDGGGGGDNFIVRDPPPRDG